MNNVKPPTQTRENSRDTCNIKHKTQSEDNTEKYDEQHEPHQQVTFGDFGDGVRFALDQQASS